MYCKKCGKEIPEGNQFCTNCGTPLAGDTQGSPPQKARKGGWLRMLLVMVICVTISTLLPKLFLNSAPKLPDIEDDGVINPAYSSTFSERFVVPPFTAFLGEKTASYVKVLSDDPNTLDNIEFAYEDGIVTDMCETLYVAVNDFDEATKALVHETILADLKAYEAIPSCSVSYNLGATAYTYTILTKDLDDTDMLQQCLQAGIVSVAQGEQEKTAYLGIKMTEDNLLSSGYIKR